MLNRTTDGSNDNEAVKIVNALKPFWKKWTKEWGRSCVRSKKMTVSTAPSLSDGVIGVTDAFSDTECMIPFKMDVANAVVGDTVWVKWMYDNQQTMYADSMGDVRAELTTLSGSVSARTVSAGSSESIQVVFEKPFKYAPVAVATMLTAQTEGTGLCSVRVRGISTTGFTIGIQNGSSYDRSIGATWIATGTLSESTNIIVVQNQQTNELFIY